MDEQQGRDCPVGRLVVENNKTGPEHRIKSTGINEDPALGCR
jgi:hypothetical protein